MTPHRAEQRRVYDRPLRATDDMHDLIGRGACQPGQGPQDWTRTTRPLHVNGCSDGHHTLDRWTPAQRRMRTTGQLVPGECAHQAGSQLEPAKQHVMWARSSSACIPSRRRHAAAPTICGRSSRAVTCLPMSPGTFRSSLCNAVCCCRITGHPRRCCRSGHQGERAARRDLRTVGYRSTACPYAKKKLPCPDGDQVRVPVRRCGVLLRRAERRNALRARWVALGCDSADVPPCGSQAEALGVQSQGGAPQRVHGYTQGLSVAAVFLF
jgi:hypothetical protein